MCLCSFSSSVLHCGRQSSAFAGSLEAAEMEPIATLPTDAQSFRVMIEQIHPMLPYRQGSEGIVLHYRSGAVRQVLPASFLSWKSHMLRLQMSAVWLQPNYGT